MPDRMSAGIISELKRRNMFRLAGLYLAGAWVVVEVAGTVLPMLEAPRWIGRAFLWLVVIGFIPAMIFGWVFEITPGGLKREDAAGNDAPASPRMARRVARRMDRAIIVVLLIGVTYLAFDKFVLTPRREAAIAATAAQGAATATASALRQQAPAIPDKSIAVLPLLNQSGDKDQQYFADGLSENLINALSQFDGLKVIGRNSAFQFRDRQDDSVSIGRKLGVANLLEGSVQRQGETVRINAQLVKAADGSTLWSQRYDRAYTDLFALQDEITQAVADALKARLLSPSAAAVQDEHPPSGNLDAYTAYLQGKFHVARNTEADQRKAADAYLTATRIDPKYALAWAELARTWTGQVVQFLSGQEAEQVVAKAWSAVETALSLSPNLAAAHTAHGRLLAATRYDWVGAEAAYRRALQLAPNDGAAMHNLGLQLATLGQVEQAAALTRKALITDPLNSNWHLWLAIELSGLGQLDEAEQSVRKAMELQPSAEGYGSVLAIIAIQRGDAKAALAAANREPPGPWRDLALALAQQISGDPAAADAALQTFIEKWPNGAFQVAEVYALRGDPDKMFEWLERAWSARDSGIGTLLLDPFLLRYRDDPRFAAFCRKVGLPSVTDARAIQLPAASARGSKPNP